MHIPIALAGSATDVLGPDQLHADLHRGRAPTRHPGRTVGTVLIRSLVWALIAIAVWASLLGLAALSTTGTAQAPPSHGPHAAHRPADPTTRSDVRTPRREPNDPSSPPATAPTSQA